MFFIKLQKCKDAKIVIMTETKTSYTNKRHPLFDAWRLMDREIGDSQKLSGTYSLSWAGPTRRLQRSPLPRPLLRAGLRQAQTPHRVVTAVMAALRRAQRPVAKATTTTAAADQVQTAWIWDNRREVTYEKAFY